MALTFTPQDQLGSSLHTFQLPATDGKTYSHEQLARKDQAVLVMFICNHCPYVQAIEDRLIQLGHDLKAINVSVIAICSNDGVEHPEDNFEALQKRAQEKNYPFVYLHDEDQSVARKFGAVCTPDFFLYDRKHQLAYRGRIDDSWKDSSKVTRRELFQAAKNLAENSPIDFKITPSMGCNIKWK